MSSILKHPLSAEIPTVCVCEVDDKMCIVFIEFLNYEIHVGVLAYIKKFHLFYTHYRHDAIVYVVALETIGELIQ